jgi:hypothetical protein
MSILPANHILNIQLSMIEKALQFYYQLQIDLDHCHTLTQTEEQIIETCFKLSMDYYSRVKSWLKDYEFPESRSEIMFFKHVKPLFTSQIEYYTHCYKAILFLPVSKNEQTLYWQRELAQIDTFYGLHSDFIKYWSNDFGDKDELYFIRASNCGTNLDQAKNYDIDVEVATSHDWLVTAILAYEKYAKFIHRKMGELE